MNDTNDYLRTLPIQATEEELSAPQTDYFTMPSNTPIPKNTAIVGYDPESKKLLLKRIERT